MAVSCSRSRKLRKLLLLKMPTGVQRGRSSPWKGDLKRALADLDMDWKRFMGLVMWYQLCPDTDLSYFIEAFGGLLEKQHAPKPVPKYVEERVSVYDNCLMAQGYDTAYYLVLLHAKKSTVDISVRRVISPAASTFDRLDQKLVVKEILNQYCEVWSSPEAQQHFLEDDHGIPTEWLHEALALCWRYSRNNKKELEHLITMRPVAECLCLVYGHCGCVTIP